MAAAGRGAIVGAPGAPSLSVPGAAYLFQLPNRTAVATLRSPNSGWEFGYSVAMSAKFALVGAPGESPNGVFESGSAYLYFVVPGAVYFDATLTSPNSQGTGYFGQSVALNSAFAFVGASGEGVAGVVGAGNAYEYILLYGAVVDRYESPFLISGSAFGQALAASGSEWLIGAPSDPTSGNVYLF
jgi:hypothetical protein